MKLSLKEQIKDICLDGLQTDGAHHKQFYFERILEFIGYDLNELRKIEKEENGIAWKRGVL